MINQHLQSWRSIDKLTKYLGWTDESDVNIQIHQARKQLANKLKQRSLGGPMLIERKTGEIWFGTANFKIFKDKGLKTNAVS